MSAWDPDDAADCVAWLSLGTNARIKMSRVRNECVFRGTAVRVRARTLLERICKVPAGSWTSTGAQLSRSNRTSAEEYSSLFTTDHLRAVSVAGGCRGYGDGS